jgi:hypothetical protein
MGRVGCIIDIRIKRLQILRVRLRVDENETTVSALDHVEFTGHPKDPVPSLKENSVII